MSALTFFQFSRFLRKYAPRAHTVGRFCYQTPFVFFSLFRKSIHTRINQVPGPEGEHFFGYYDKSPWDISGRFFLSLRVPFSDREPSVCDKGIIEVVDLQAGKARDVGITHAWNLQQGCRLQWLGPDFSSRIAFNDFRNGRFVAVIRDLVSENERILERPFYDVSHDGRFAISLDFERLHAFRPGYGYNRGKKICDFPVACEDDGLWLLNLESGESRLILSFDEIASETSHDTGSISATHFNPIMFNPSGERFLFLYRWSESRKEYTRLYTTKYDGSDRCCLSCNGIVSHTTWKTDDLLLAWVFRRDYGDNYLLFRDHEGIIDVVGSGVLTEDGHPSYSPCGRFILTDTYTNRARQRCLLIYDTITDEVHTLGAFYIPFRYSGETGCDLHPRWKASGTEVSVDSTYKGNRQIYIVAIPHGILEEVGTTETSAVSSRHESQSVVVGRNIPSVQTSHSSQTREELLRDL